MKKDKKSDSPDPLPQMTLFESAPVVFEPLPSPGVKPPSPPEAAPLERSGPTATPARARATGGTRNQPRTKAAAKAETAQPRQPTNQKAPALTRSRTSSAVPEGDVRLTANIREDLHLKLKIAAARQRTTIGELIEQWVESSL